MAGPISKISTHTQFRFLEELDTPVRLNTPGYNTEEKGIRAHHNLGILDRLFGWIKGNTIEVKVGNREFILSRRSLEDFLIRNKQCSADDLAIRSWAGKYTFLVEQLKEFMEKNKVAIADAAKKLEQNHDKRPSIQLKKDMYEALLGKEIKLSFTAFKDLTIDFKKVVAELRREAPASVLAPLQEQAERMVIIPLPQAPGVPDPSQSVAAAVSRVVLQVHQPNIALDPEMPPSVSLSLSALQQEELVLQQQEARIQAEKAAYIAQRRNFEGRVRAHTVQQLNALFKAEKAFRSTEVQEAELRKYRNALANSTYKALNNMNWYTVSATASPSEFVLRSYRPKTGVGTRETLEQIPFFGKGIQIASLMNRPLFGGDWTSTESVISVQQDGRIIIQGDERRNAMTFEEFQHVLESTNEYSEQISGSFLGKIEEAATAAAAEKVRSKGALNSEAASEREELLHDFAAGKAYLKNSSRAYQYLNGRAGKHVTKAPGDLLNDHYAFSSTKYGWYLHRVDTVGDVWRYKLELPPNGGFIVIDPVVATKKTHYADIPSLLKGVCGLTDEQIENNAFLNSWTPDFLRR